jgi:uncharacterized membrane protein YphA (DoxX/SURF4 family)
MTKYLAHVPRIFLGFVFTVAGTMGLLHMLPAQQLEGPAAVYMAGMTGSYLFTLVKATEVAVGLLLLSNRFVPLALVVLAPVMVNVFAFHALYAPSGLVTPVLLVAAQIFVAWQHRAAFSPLLTAKSVPAQSSAEGARVQNTAAAA